MTALPMLVSAEGEIVQALTAENLLHALGVPDPRTAETDALAAFVDHADHFASLTKEAREVASEELVRRMDKRGKWTLHTGGLTLKSSSPAAGTEKYDDGRLLAAVVSLVEEGLIDEEAASAAIEFIEPPAPAPYWKQKPAGIKALLKLGGRVTEAVLSAMVPVEPPRRSVKVSRERER